MSESNSDCCHHGPEMHLNLLVRLAAVCFLEQLFDYGRTHRSKSTFSASLALLSVATNWSFSVVFIVQNLVLSQASDHCCSESVWSSFSSLMSLN